MQLFCVDYEQQGSKIHIKDVELVQQVRKVLRMSKGNYIAVQQINWPTHRHTIQITERDDKSLRWDIQSTQELLQPLKKLSMIISMPNKRDKAELITQKLSEIGVYQIIFRPSERSIIRESNPKKMQRLQKISKEAVEQSRGTRIPEIIYVSHIDMYTKNTQIVVFDIQEKEWKTQQIKLSEQNIQENIVWSICTGLIGPEGGLTDHDYQSLDTYIVKSLGNTILRTETAAIIAARYLQNY